MQTSYLILSLLIIISIVLFILSVLPTILNWDCAGFVGTKCPATPVYYCQIVAGDIGKCIFTPWKLLTNIF